MSAIGTRIEKARILRGFSLRKLADSTGLSHTQIRYIEKGQRSLNGPTLLLIAKSLDLPVDYFVREETFRSREVSYRKIKALSEKKQSMIWQMIELQVENYLEIEEILAIRHNFTSEYLSDIESIEPEDIDDIACRVRDHFALGRSPIASASALLEEMGIIVVGIKGEKGFDGVSLLVDDHIPVITYNTEISQAERVRMTLLHELGHLLLNDKLRARSKKEIEDVCTSFASHLLLPDQILKSYFWGRVKTLSMTDLEELQSTYGISIDAIIYRLKALLFISESKYKSYWMKKNASPELKSEIEKSRYEEPLSQRFVRLVIRALDKSLITMSKAKVYLSDAGISAEMSDHLLNSSL